MQKVSNKVMAVALLGASLIACNRQPTPEAICRSLEQEKIAEGCKEGADPSFTVPRHGSQWTFMMAELSERVDPVFGKAPKPSGVIIQFESLKDRDVAVEYANGMNAVLPFFPFIHKLENPPMLVLMPQHEGSLRSRGVLDRLYGYSR